MIPKNLTTTASLLVLFSCKERRIGENQVFIPNDKTLNYKVNLLYFLFIRESKQRESPTVAFSGIYTVNFLKFSNSSAYGSVRHENFLTEINDIALCPENTNVGYPLSKACIPKIEYKLLFFPHHQKKTLQKTLHLPRKPVWSSLNFWDKEHLAAFPLKNFHV